MSFTKFFEDTYFYRDILNVFVIKDEDSAILIDFGSGDILNRLNEFGIKNIQQKVINTSSNNAGIYNFDNGVALESILSIHSVIWYESSFHSISFYCNFKIINIITFNFKINLRYGK